MLRRLRLSLGLLVWTTLLCCFPGPLDSVPVNRSSRMIREIYPEVNPEDLQVCLVDDVAYSTGSRIPSEDVCQECVCNPPSIECEKKRCLLQPGCKAIHKSTECCPTYQCECEYNGTVYSNGEKLESLPGSECKNCYCRGGEIKCTEIGCYTRDDCEPRYVKGECCPKYDHCPPREPLDRKSSTQPTSLESSSTAASASTKESSNEFEGSGTEFEEAVTKGRPKITILEVTPSSSTTEFLDDESSPYFNDINHDIQGIKGTYRPSAFRIGDKILFLERGQLVPEKDASTPSSVITLIGAEGLQIGVEGSDEIDVKTTNEGSSGVIEVQLADDPYIVNQQSSEERSSSILESSESDSSSSSETSTEQSSIIPLSSTESVDSSPNSRQTSIDTTASESRSSAIAELVTTSPQTSTEETTKEAKLSTDQSSSTSPNTELSTDSSSHSSTTRSASVSHTDDDDTTIPEHSPEFPPLPDDMTVPYISVDTPESVPITETHIKPTEDPFQHKILPDVLPIRSNKTAQNQSELISHWLKQGVTILANTTDLVLVESTDSEDKYNSVEQSGGERNNSFSEKPNDSEEPSTSEKVVPKFQNDGKWIIDEIPSATATASSESSAGSSTEYSSESSTESSTGYSFTTSSAEPSTEVYTTSENIGTTIEHLPGFSRTREANPNTDSNQAKQDYSTTVKSTTASLLTATEAESTESSASTHTAISSSVSTEPTAKSTESSTPTQYTVSSSISTELTEESTESSPSTQSAVPSSVSTELTAESTVSSPSTQFTVSSSVSTKLKDDSTTTPFLTSTEVESTESSTSRQSTISSSVATESTNSPSATFDSSSVSAAETTDSLASSQHSPSVSAESTQSSVSIDTSPLPTVILADSPFSTISESPKTETASTDGSTYPMLETISTIQFLSTSKEEISSERSTETVENDDSGETTTKKNNAHLMSSENASVDPFPNASQTESTESTDVEILPGFERSTQKSVSNVNINNRGNEEDVELIGTETPHVVKKVLKEQDHMDFLLYNSNNRSLNQISTYDKARNSTGLSEEDLIGMSSNIYIGKKLSVETPKALKNEPSASVVPSPATISEVPSFGNTHLSSFSTVDTGSSRSTSLSSKEGTVFETSTSFTSSDAPSTDNTHFSSSSSSIEEIISTIQEYTSLSPSESASTL